MTELRSNGNAIHEHRSAVFVPQNVVWRVFYDKGIHRGANRHGSARDITPLAGEKMKWVRLLRNARAFRVGNRSAMGLLLGYRLFVAVTSAWFRLDAVINHAAAAWKTPAAAPTDLE